METTAARVEHERTQCLQARTFIAEGKLAEATHILTGLVQAETTLFEPYHELGCLAVQQDDVDAAILLFEAALKKNPESQPTRRNLVRMQGLRQQYDDVKKLVVDVKSPDVAEQKAIEERERAQAAKANQFLADSGYLSASGLTGLKWFSTRDEYLDWDLAVGRVQGRIEAYIAEHQLFYGYCRLCEKQVAFVVSSGTRLGEHIHLREGMICTSCGIHNRGRVLGLAVKDFVKNNGDESKLLLMEAITPLYKHFHAKLRNLIGTEFRSINIPGGSILNMGGHNVRHENILNLSFADESLDVIAHADLLEHVPDVVAALRECHRVLRRGGELIFSAPFAQTMDRSAKRAELMPSGEIRHIHPEEYHGTHLAFYNFGWDLLDFIHAAGFSKVRMGVCFDPLQGLLSTGRFGGFFMQPLFFSCVR